jgi:hypothetical protein
MVIFKKKTVFYGHLGSFCVERILIQYDVPAVCVKIAPAPYMKQYLTVAYRIVLDDSSFRETVGLQSHLILTAIVTFIQIDVEYAIVQLVCNGSTWIILLCHVHYLKPVYHPIGEEKTDDKISIYT